MWSYQQAAGNAGRGTRSCTGVAQVGNPADHRLTCQHMGGEAWCRQSYTPPPHAQRTWLVSQQFPMVTERLTVQTSRIMRCGQGAERSCWTLAASLCCRSFPSEQNCEKNARSLLNSTRASTCASSSHCPLSCQGTCKSTLQGGSVRRGDGEQVCVRRRTFHSYSTRVCCTSEGVPRPHQASNKLEQLD